MSELISKNGLNPNVAILCSNGADNVCARNNFSFSEMLAPFRNVQVSIRDPNNQLETCSLAVDFRDVRTDGYLLSLTVLPSVLQEVLKTFGRGNGEDVWSGSFISSFQNWFEPAEHDYLKAYLSCIFVVSPEDENAMAKLDELVTQQNQLQHSYSNASLNLPAYCTAPKWFFPQTLKYYVVLSDRRKTSKEEADALMKNIGAKYGNDVCYSLQINSADDAGLPDNWIEISTKKHCLKEGLEAARRELINSQNGLQQEESPQPGSAKRELCGKCMTTEDREGVQQFIRTFVSKALVPFAEKQMSTLNETLVSKRGIGKSFTSMRKWLNVATTTPANNSDVNYAPESAEVQTRKLADLAFLFGAFSFAYQLYHSLKKDFLNDQAWLYHAGSLEMAAVSAYLAGTSTNKNFPVHYIQNSLNYYLETCMQPLLFFRSILFGSSVLEGLGRTQESANLIVRLVSDAKLPDLFKAVSLEHASTLYGKCNMNRKKCLFSFLAAKYYLTHKLVNLSESLLEGVLSECSSKNLKTAENNVLWTMIQEVITDTAFSREFLEMLIKNISLQSEEEQQHYFASYLRACNGIGVVDIPFPLVEQEMFSVFYGHHGVDLINGKSSEVDDELLDLARNDISRTSKISVIPKNGIEAESCFNVNTTPIGERCSFKVQLCNPLSIDLIMKNVRLGFSNDINASQVEVISIEQIYLPSISTESPAENIVEVILKFTPLEPNLTVEVTSILCDISSSDQQYWISGIILLKPKQLKTKQGVKEDYRLKVKTSASPWPLLSYQLSHKLEQMDKPTSISLKCGQQFEALFILENVSVYESNQVLSITTNSPNEVVLFEDSQPLRLNDDGVFKLNSSAISIGQKRSFKLVLFGVDEVVTDKPIKLLFAYSSDGILRYFSWEFLITTEKLLTADIIVIDQTCGLCALNVKNVALSSFSEVEILNVGIRSYPENFGSNLALTPLSQRNILIENSQEDTYCFKISANHSGDGSLFFRELPQNVKEWSKVSSTSTKTSTLFFQVVWKARITSELGTTVTVFGRLRVPNPFVLQSPEVDYFTTLACPSLFLEDFFSKQSISMPWFSETFTLSKSDIQKLTNDIISKLSVKEAKIPWSLKHALV